MMEWFGTLEFGCGSLLPEAGRAEAGCLCFLPPALLSFLPFQNNVFSQSGLNAASFRRRFLTPITIRPQRGQLQEEISRAHNSSQ